MIVIQAALVVVPLVMLLAVVRIVRGPSEADRGAAADVIFFGFVVLVALIGIVLDTGMVIDIVLVCTIVGFLAAVSLARLITGGNR